ncbi:hypothetical protein BC826DRAFT_1101886 [Russula brevipes]|nr:hypothetical protein BC826DRAFT_1101886 [Russula brevipes]
MSELPHAPARHPSPRENTVPFPHAPSISRQSLSLSSADIESLGYSYSDAYANLSHDPDATYHARLCRSPAGSIRSLRIRPAAQQLSPVAEENEERRRSRGSRSLTSSPLTHRSSLAAALSLSEPPAAALAEPPVVEIFPEDITEAIMSLLPRVEARAAAIARHSSRRSKVSRAIKRFAKAAGTAISGAAKSIPAFSLKFRY